MANKEDLINEVVREVETAEFVAVDLEFTGLFESEPIIRAQCLEEHYQRCAQNVQKFLVVELGICAARRDPDDVEKWHLTPRNFYVFPTQRTTFTCDSQSIAWLKEQGFRFDKWVQDGMDYVPLGCIQYAEQNQTTSQLPVNISQTGLQRIIEALIIREKPVVVHNGILDMMHVFDKFIGRVPESLAEFCSEWLRLFVGGVYDTKYIATRGRRLFTTWPDCRKTSLQRLNERLKQATQSKLYVHHSESHRLTLNDDGSSGNAHEAGYDAQVTAEVFIMELELCFGDKELEKRLSTLHDQDTAGFLDLPEGPAEGRNRSRSLEITADEVCTAPVPLNWMNERLGRMLVNRIETGAYGGMNLRLLKFGQPHRRVRGVAQSMDLGLPQQLTFKQPRMVPSNGVNPSKPAVDKQQMISSISSRIQALAAHHAGNRTGNIGAPPVSKEVSHQNRLLITGILKGLSPFLDSSGGGSPQKRPPETEPIIQDNTAEGSGRRRKKKKKPKREEDEYAASP